LWIYNKQWPVSCFNIQYYSLISLFSVEIEEQETNSDMLKEANAAKKRSRASKELDDLKRDNNERADADKQLIWRKIEKTLAKNDATVTE